MSFPLNINSKKETYLGDIIISYQFVNKPKGSSNLEFKKKLIKLFIHGFLHLLGYDHKTNHSIKAYIRKILITSDFAIYNRENNNTNFFDNVIITESQNKITADKLNFVYTSDMIYLRENIIMNNEFGTLLSDMVDISLNEGIAKIYMTDNKEQVKVNYEKND